ncbi:hypothetical protein [Kitasatospora sp. LaBMicrA B282]|uniref:hypothetical protein n=1 Tax=Kitasatospora sp. LaBMicrA B282 TaxID=3420949 RepID=UPI003D0B0121
MGAQRGGWADLVEEQRGLLPALGISQAPVLAAERPVAAVKVAGRRSQAQRFQQGLDALALSASRVRAMRGYPVPTAEPTWRWGCG